MNILEIFSALNIQESKLASAGLKVVLLILKIVKIFVIQILLLLSLRFLRILRVKLLLLSLFLGLFLTSWIIYLWRITLDAQVNL